MNLIMEIMAGASFVSTGCIMKVHRPNIELHARVEFSSGCYKFIEPKHGESMTQSYNFKTCELNYYLNKN